MCSLQVWETEICFLNSHLAAHQDKVKARNNNYRWDNNNYRWGGNYRWDGVCLVEVGWGITLFGT